MKNCTRVVLASGSYLLPEDLTTCIVTLQGHLDSIPEEYRNTACIESGREYGYGDDCYFTTEIYFYRPETKQEQEIREAKEHNQNMAQEQRDRVLLENLLKKYK